MKQLMRLFITFFAIGTLQAQSNDLQLSDAQKVYGLSKMCTEVKYNFVFYDQLSFDWDSLCMASVPDILATQTPYAYYKEMKRICAWLGDGHTSINYMNGPDRKERISPLPVTFKKYGDRIFANQVYSKKLKENGLVRGTELLKINEQRVYDYGLEEVMPYVSSSTPQWTDYKTFCSFELTKGRIRDSMTIEYKDLKGKINQLTLDKSSIKWDDQTERETFQYKPLANDIGYLRITSFDDGDSDKKFDDIYKQLQTTNGLVIDLRNNEGGNSLKADYVLRHFSNKPFRSNVWSSPMYIPAHASWGKAREWYSYGPSLLTPVETTIYTKSVVLLINAGTFSSAEDFCIKFQGMKRGKIVGTRSGGSSGNAVSIELVKDVIDIDICSIKEYGYDGTQYIGVGILPDIECEESLKDFLNHKDVVLEKAIQIMQRSIAQ